MKINSILKSGAIRHPNKDALVTPQRTWTYRQLQEDAAKTATLFTDRGAGEGSTIAAMTYNEAEFVITAFATWMLGATFVPVNHKFATPEAKYILEHCEATLGVVSPELLETATEAAPGMQWLQTGDDDGFLQDIAHLALHEEEHENDQDAALILYTSGTTSSPKGCVHTHEGISRLMPLLAHALDYHSNTRTLVAMPIWHSAPLNVSTMPTLFVGGTVILEREYHPVETMQRIVAERVTNFFGPSIAFLAPLQIAKKKWASISATMIFHPWKPGHLVALQSTKPPPRRSWTTTSRARTDSSTGCQNLAQQAPNFGPRISSARLAASETTRWSDSKCG